MFCFSIYSILAKLVYMVICIVKVNVILTGINVF